MCRRLVLPNLHHPHSPTFSNLSFFRGEEGGSLRGFLERPIQPKCRSRRQPCLRRGGDVEEDDQPRPATIRELQEIVRSLNVRKAPGLNKIGNGTLRTTPVGRLEDIRDIGNAVMKLNYFPTPTSFFRNHRLCQRLINHRAYRSELRSSHVDDADRRWTPIVHMAPGF